MDSPMQVDPPPTVSSYFRGIQAPITALGPDVGNFGQDLQRHVQSRLGQGYVEQPSAQEAVGGLKEWNKGVFHTELTRLALKQAKQTGGTAKPTVPSKGPVLAAPRPVEISTGSWDGTQKALSEIYERVITKHESYHDVVGFESSIPVARTKQERRDLYTFQKPGSDNYPPHLDQIPPGDSNGYTEIFDKMRLADVAILVASIIPVDFVYGSPDYGSHIANVEATNKSLVDQKKLIYELPNIGVRPDWYSDAVFAQQQFTGTNPTTIEIASAQWFQRFTEAAKLQGITEVVGIIKTAYDAKSLYVQDYSYFRSAMGFAADAPITTGVPPWYDLTGEQRWGSAPVALFDLTPEGVLHPLAIVIDYKGSMDKSVTIFNQRLLPTYTSDSESTDWPWRFAKASVLSADWLRHEVTVHLCNTHLVEETVIVASHRAFDDDHIIYQLLQPHWYKTLSLNAAARSTLVPSVIVPLCGINGDQAYAFLKDAYKRYDWVGKYVPNDLDARGFPISELENGPRMHNYAYARNMMVMWQILRTFVKSVLDSKYSSDKDVQADSGITSWYTEMRSDTGAQMKSFPIITTKDQLIDAVTMCIHTASPEHTAVNYLQEYYQSFVLNKPPAFFTELPQTLKELKAMTEDSLVKAYPMNHPKHWLLASHVPHLLSLRVDPNQNLPNYALSVYKIAVGNGDKVMEDAGDQLYRNLGTFAQAVAKHSSELDDQTVPYDVMDPNYTATSILI